MLGVKCAKHNFRCITCFLNLYNDCNGSNEGSFRARCVL